MNLMKWLLPACCLLVIGCNQEKASDKKAFADPHLFAKTVKELNNVVLQNNFPPMIASRNYAYASIAAYEVIAAGNTEYKSLAGQVKHLAALPKADTANVNFHFASLLAFCKVGEAVTFPEGSMSGYVQELMEIADSVDMPQKVKTASQAFANHVADHILKWSKGDNYLQTRSAAKFTVLQQEGRWVPTPPTYDQALEAHWMEVRPILMDSCSQFKPVRPPAFDLTNKNSEFYQALMEVKSIGDSLTDEQKHIADFWDDNPMRKVVVGHAMYTVKKFSPPGHWMNIVGIGAKKANANFETTVMAYAQTAIALFDGFISCWDEKYRSNYVRPETVISKHLDANWSPYIQTPPFPSYTSGHSTVSAAAAEVMTSIFGNIPFKDTSLLEFGIGNREFQHFRHAAQEANISRVYGGIHFRFDCDNGNASGRRLGEYIVSRLNMNTKPQLTTNNN